MLPRGVRNNNPSNIERNYIRWDGMSEDQSGDDRFVIFDEPEMGIRALAKILLTYKRKHKIDTVRGIINRFAPPSDNNDTGSYIGHVCQHLDTGPDETLNCERSETMLLLCEAIIKHELGGAHFYPTHVLMRGVVKALE